MITTEELKTATNGILQWGEHPENSSLVVLQVKQFGLWYTIPYTTVHSVADKRKHMIMEVHARNLGLI